MSKRRRGYITTYVSEDVNIFIDDIIDEIDDDVLLDEIKDRGLISTLAKTVQPEINYNSICDLFSVNYYTPIPKLIELLTNKLESDYE